MIKIFVVLRFLTKILFFFIMRTMRTFSKHFDTLNDLSHWYFYPQNEQLLDLIFGNYEVLVQKLKKVMPKEIICFKQPRLHTSNVLESKDNETKWTAFFPPWSDYFKWGLSLMNEVTMV